MAEILFRESTIVRGAGRNGTWEPCTPQSEFGAPQIVTWIRGMFGV
jgi:hypothetical protein